MDVPFKFQVNEAIIVKFYTVNKNWSCTQLYESIQQTIERDYNLVNIRLSVTGIELPSGSSNVPFVSFLNSFNFNTLAFHLSGDLQERSVSPPQPTVCSICLTNCRNIVFLPCRHLVTCSICANRESIDTCVVCRSFIATKLEVYT